MALVMQVPRDDYDKLVKTAYQFHSYHLEGEVRSAPQCEEMLMWDDAYEDVTEDGRLIKCYPVNEDATVRDCLYFLDMCVDQFDQEVRDLTEFTFVWK